METTCRERSKNTTKYTFGLRYLRIDQVKFFKGCLSQILLGPFLNNVTLLEAAVYWFTTE